MRASWVLIQAQIKNKKGSYISILVLTLIIGLMLSISLSLVVNIRSAAQNAVEASNFGDLYMNFSHDYSPTNEDLSKLNEMTEIDHVVALQKIKVRGEPASLTHSNDEITEVAFEPAIYVYNQDQLSLRLLSEDQTSYISTDQVAPPKRGEAYFPIFFIDMYDAELGDLYIIETQHDTFEYKIAGFVEDITQINMVSIGEHNVYLNQDDFDDLERKAFGDREEALLDANNIFPGFSEYSSTYTLHLHISDDYIDHKTSDLFQRIEEETGLRKKSAFYVDDEQFVYFASLISYIILLVIIIFVLVLFVASLAILNFNIYSSIESEYKNIGVMKAVGLTNSSFNSVYIFSYLAVIIMGLVAGSLLAMPILNLVAPVFLDLTSMLASSSLALGPIALSYLILILICLFLILWQLRGISKIKPYQALRENKQAVYSSAGLKMKLRKPLFYLRLSVKQFTASAGTYFGSIFVVALLFFFLLIGSSMTTIMNPDRLMEDFWGFDWDLMVFYNNEDQYNEFHDEVNAMISEEAQIIDSYLVYQNVINGLDQNIATFVLEEKYIDRMTSLVAGRAPHNADEIAITKILADSKDIKIGDEVEFSFEDKKVTYTVSGFFQTVNYVGRSVVLTTSALERLMGETYKDSLTQVWYTFENQNVSDSVRDKILDEYPNLDASSIGETMDDFGLMSDAFDLLPVIIFVFAAFFVVISSFLLAEKIFNREQIDFGIMKAIGFKNATTRQIFSFRFVIVALIGLILGGVIFYFSANPLMNTLASFMGLSQVNIKIPTVQVLISGLAMITIFWFITFIISGKIRKLKVRDLVADV